MLKGASLFYATVIALLIAILCSSIILFSYYKLQERTIYNVQGKICSNVISGIHLLMSDGNADSVTHQVITDLYDNRSDSAMLKTIPWGGFKVVACKAFLGKKNISKAAIIGSLCKNSDSVALYLQDANKPLFLCGDAFVQGICYLPSAGVKRGYIDGKNFNGTTLINGVIRQSGKTITNINKNLIQQIKSLMAGRNINGDSNLNLQNIRGAINNSFFNRTIYIHSHGIINLNSGAAYSGNIIITSDTLITIQSGCIINDIIIYAPYVKIEKYFNGNAQIYASDSMYIEEGCTLKYPSLLGLISQKITAGKLSSLIIEAGDTINGDIFIDNEIPATRQQVLLSVMKDAVVNGNVYSNGGVQLNGSIYGSLTCSKMVLSTQSGQYDDYIMDGKIDVSKVSKFYASSLLNSSGQKTIAKWVF